MKILDRLKSTKFWLGIILYPVLVIVNRKAKLGLTDTDLWTIVAGVGAWIYAQGNVDAAKAADVSGLAQEVAEKAIAMLMTPKAKPADGQGPAPETK